MPKRILDVGNCRPDHSEIKSLLARHFDCEVVQAHGADDALSELKAAPYDLVLVNRKLDRDYSDGIDVIRQIKGDSDVADIPCMLVTNYPEHQEAAVAVGAVRGFGKLELERRETAERLRSVLEPDSQT